MKVTTSLAMSLSLAFAASASAEETPRTPVLHTAEESLWRPQSMDVVIGLRRCPETTACGEIVWYNPEDSRVRTNFGNPQNRAENLCGFSPRMSFNEVNANEWRGRMNIRGRGVTVGMKVVAVDADTIRLTANLGPFKKHDVWTRVAANDPRYPRCTR